MLALACTWLPALQLLVQVGAITAAASLATAAAAGHGRALGATEDTAAAGGDVVWRSSSCAGRGTAAADSCSAFAMQRSGTYTFTPAPGAPGLAGSVAASSCGGALAFNATTGDDEAGPLGAWQQLAVGAHCVVRYYPRADAFVFSRLQRRVALPWPRLQFTAATDSDWGALSWGAGAAMVKGNAAPSLRAWAAGNPAATANATLHGTPGGFGGPVLLWHKTNATGHGAAAAQAPGAAVAIAPLDHWDSNALLLSKASATYRDGCDEEEGPSDDCWLAAGVAALPIVPAEGVRMSTVLLGRPGLQRATRALGAVLRNVHNTTRIRDANVETLSYWSDNAAGYSFWSVPNNDIDIWGPIGALFLKLHEEYMKAGIAFGSWESDNTMGRIPAIDANGTSHGGWCFSDWTAWNRTLYPTGGSVRGDGWPAKMRALQNSAIQQPMSFV